MRLFGVNTNGVKYVVPSTSHLVYHFAVKYVDKKQAAHNHEETLKDGHCFKFMQKRKHPRVIR